MKSLNEVRIDKWLWSVRLFKTRSLATEACKKGRIIINNVQVKPSRMVRQNEIVEIKLPPITKTYKITVLLDNRVAAKLVPDYIEDLTPASEYDKLETFKEGSFIFRHKGLGRPTKRDRRLIDGFVGFEEGGEEDE
ncbi:MAG: heat-shock protein Hsp15 [Bacteroidetes bacterium GWF2_38_335]|nr:MAG: heat-shock protein Hsp15 [Bacteroidetes bacterium GWF2_38_335]OFY79474.1 MAG: heat-shock protein Hsp15 [Bacteroidetes bacterium RIFOXYA12_FULL_38_20]HBS86590.1 heat-shock protein Hsp15 [Bacteroidales bacterium]